MGTVFLLPFIKKIKLNKNINAFSFQELATLISIVNTEKIGGFNLTVYDVVALGRTPYLSLFGKLTVNDESIIEKSLTNLFKK